MIKEMSIEIIAAMGELNYLFHKTLEDEISQNVINIVTRIKGNVPLNRHKGIDNTLIDEPQEIIKARLAAEIIEEIEREEPRFEAIEIIFKGNDFFSKLNVTIIGNIKEGE